MLELELNAPGAGPAGEGGAALDRLAFFQAAALEECQTRPCLVLHADWSRPPAYLEELLPPWRERGFGLVTCCRADERVEELPGGLGEKDMLSLSLEGWPPADSTLAHLAGRAELDLFLPLERPDQDQAPLWQALEALPRVKALVIGLGWRDRRSGPQPLAAGDFPAWAETVLDLAQRLTARRVELGAACGIPLCLFTRQQLGALSALRLRWPLAHCKPNPLVTARGALVSCRGLAGFRPRPLAEVVSLGQAHEAWVQQQQPFRSLCRHSPTTVPCLSLQCEACGGGCLEQEMRAWRGGKA